MEKGPEPAETSIDEDTLQLPKNARTFALEVRGDSMIDAHIVSGDVVIMELRDPTHRDTVPALSTEKRR
jgi:repressor LexA